MIDRHGPHRRDLPGEIEQAFLNHALALAQQLVRARARRRTLLRLCVSARRRARLARSPMPRGAGEHPRTSLPAIERQVMCVTCKIPLNVAQSPQANREREFIQGLIDRRPERSADQARAGRPVRPVGARAAEHARLRPDRLPRPARGRARAARHARAAAAPLAPPRARPSPAARSSPAARAPPTPRAWRPTWRASTDRASAFDWRYISRGALTPSRSRQRAIVRCAATDSANPQRFDALGLRAETRQSR